jgi:large subunit ribosomal protein L4
VKDLARRSALTQKVKADAVRLLDGMSMSSPKTKDFAALLKAFDVSDRRSLLVLPSMDSNVVLSARNLQGARVVSASEVNTYDIMNATKVLIVTDAIAPLEATLTK